MANSQSMKIKDANVTARKCAVGLLAILCVVLLWAGFVREWKESYWQGVLALVWSVCIPAALFIKAHDSLGKMAKGYGSKRDPLASTYLCLFLFVCLVVAVVAGYYGLAPALIPVGNNQLERGYHDFGANIGNVCMIVGPLFSFLLSLEVFTALGVMEKKS